MKVITPTSYQKMFTITAGSNVVSPQRALFLVITNSSNSIAFTFQDGSTLTLSDLTTASGTTTGNIILPLSVAKVTAATNITVYGMI